MPEITLPAAADLYGDVIADERRPLPPWRTLPPGLIVVTLATLAAAYLSGRYGAPLTLMALLMGLALNFLGSDRRLAPGLHFAASTLLRVGIVLVGLRVTLGQIADLGPVTLIGIVVIVAAVLGTGALLGRTLGLGVAFGTLAGGAVAICGASAALAFASLLGEKRINGAQLTIVLIGISAASAFAMFAYPILVHLVGFDDRQAGVVLGASIHDVAQALGAGYSVSHAAGDVASIVKLTRVALLAPALAVVGLFFGSAGARAGFNVPWFVIGFLALATLGQLIAIPAVVSGTATVVANNLLAAAVAATGLRAPLDKLRRVGVRPLLIIAGCSAVALLLAGLLAKLG